ncbi:hypothetical protein O181_074615 [Austropuccinia psidii MF-1]|uniref:Uncharacterized protein n=1 Tax=Austropuccinia psidii MF-1 TaxID=1389203 RepID=A0A9Q3F4X7_9BASI|nr:hypothetical protein [Austropuccinia psidii MF-1]
MTKTTKDKTSFRTRPVRARSYPEGYEPVHDDFQYPSEPVAPMTIPLTRVYIKEARALSPLIQAFLPAQLCYKTSNHISFGISHQSAMSAATSISVQNTHVNGSDV